MRKAEILLKFQPYTDKLPASKQQLYAQAANNDDVTVKAWRKKWIDNITANKAHFGSFNSKNMSSLWNMWEGKPTICAGAGPSLKYNGHLLKDRKDVKLISCLHNFHFFEDLDIHPELYVSLDAGEITIREVTEGGTKSEEEYWEATRKHKLVCYIGTHPELLKKWRGEIYFFNAPLPSKDVIDEVDAIEKYTTFVSSGGNVLGACMYIAKITGSFLNAMVGADFSFSNYDCDRPMFHAWDSPYDVDMGVTVGAVDVYGNRVQSWQSYLNFAAFFNWLAVSIPGHYVNCTEGGIWGSTHEGNILHVRQTTLQEFLDMCHMHYQLKEHFLVGNLDEKKILY